MKRSNKFPASAMDQFNAGEPWDYVAGSRQVFTQGFYEQYNDEAWAYITPGELRSDGTGLHGFDMEKLNNYLTALHN